MQASLFDNSPSNSSFSFFSLSFSSLPLALYTGNHGAACSCKTGCNDPVACNIAPPAPTPAAGPEPSPASKAISKAMTIEVVVPVVIGGLVLFAVVGVIVALIVKKSKAAQTAAAIDAGGVNGEGDYARMGDTVGDAADPYA